MNEDTPEAFGPPESITYLASVVGTHKYNVAMQALGVLEAPDYPGTTYKRLQPPGPARVRAVGRTIGIQPAFQGIQGLEVRVELSDPQSGKAFVHMRWAGKEEHFDPQPYLDAVEDAGVKLLEERNRVMPVIDE